MTESSIQADRSDIKAATARRLINILATIYSLLISTALFFCVWQIYSIPQPREFELTSDPAGAAKLAREMKSHLNQHPELTQFENRWYFDRMYDSVVEPKQNDRTSAEKRIELLNAGYRGVFETHEEILRYLAHSAIAGLFFSILVRLLPGFLSYTGLLLSSLSLTPPMSELFTGRHLGHLLVYSLPFLIISLVIATSPLVAFTAKRLRGQTEIPKGWTKLAFGASSLLIGTGGLVWIFVEVPQVRHQTGTAAGLLIVYGIREIVIGIRALLADRKRRGDDRSKETQAPRDLPL